MNTPPLFTVRRATDDTLNDLNVRIVGLSEDVAGATGKCLLFQRALESTDQDRALAMDTFAVSNEVGATEYGCVRGYSLGPNSLRLQFTLDGSDALGVPQDTLLALDLSDRAITTIRSGLKAVLTGVEHDDA
jgi:hypothetical protein